MLTFEIPAPALSSLSPRALQAMAAIDAAATGEDDAVILARLTAQAAAGAATPPLASSEDVRWARELFAATDSRRAAAPTSMPPSASTGWPLNPLPPDRAEEEWHSVPVLQQHFPTAAAYANYRRATAPSQIASPATAKAPLAPPAAPLPTVPTDRNAAIDAATLPGCEALAAQLKADMSISAASAAVQIATRYRELRGIPARHVAAAQTTPDGWKAEWAASAELRRDFPTAEAYAGWQQGVKDGRVRVYQPGAGIILHNAR